MKLQFNTSKTYAIALEGGGAKGAYQVGVWKAFEENGVKYNAVAGSSVGSLNGALMAMHHLSVAEELWSNIEYSQVMDVDDKLMKSIFKLDFKSIDIAELTKNAVDTVKNGGFDVKPLRNLLDECVDEDLIRKSDVDFYIVTYSLSDHKELNINAKTLGVGEIKDMLLASAYFPAFKHEKLGGKMYTDGGISNVVPIDTLIKQGYKDIIAFRIFGVGVEKNITIPDDVNLYTVAPKAKLGNVLNFDSKQSRHDMKLGYYDAMRFLYGLCGNKYYIDRTLTERQAYSFLNILAGRMCELTGKNPTLREINEEIIPKIERLSGGKGDYYDILISYAEKCASYLDIDEFCIMTDVEILEKVIAKHSIINRKTVPAYIKCLPSDKLCILEAK